MEIKKYPEYAKKLLVAAKKPGIRITSIEELRQRYESKEQLPF